MNISVVIPVRNRPKVLQRAIDSIKAQTTTVSEIIIVDDGSDDNETQQVVLNENATDSRFKLIKQGTRQGASAARNVGWRNSTSEWIAFLDSDDAWQPNKLEKQLALLQENPDAIACFTGYQAIGLDIVSIPPKNINLFMLQRANVLSTTSTALVRRSALEETGGFDATLPSCQDWDLWVRLAKIGRIIVLPQPLTLFEHEGTDRITKNFNNVMAGHKIMLQRMLSDNQNPIKKIRIKSSHYARLSQIYLHDFHDSKKSLTYALKSLALFPNRTAINMIKENRSS